MVQVSNAAALYKKCNLSVARKKGRKEERKKENSNCGLTKVSGDITEVGLFMVNKPVF